MPSSKRRTAWDSIKNDADYGEGKVPRLYRLRGSPPMSMSDAMNLVRPGPNASRRARIDACIAAVQLSDGEVWTEDTMSRTSFQRVLDDVDPWDVPPKVQKPIPEALKLNPTSKFTSALGTASTSEILKQMYSQQSIETLAFSSPMFGMMAQQNQVQQQNQGLQGLQQSQNVQQAQAAMQGVGVWQQTGQDSYQLGYHTTAETTALSVVREDLRDLVAELNLLLDPSTGSPGNITISDLDGLVDRLTHVRNIAEQWLGHAP